METIRAAARIRKATDLPWFTAWGERLYTSAEAQDIWDGAADQRAEEQVARAIDYRYYGTDEEEARAYGRWEVEFGEYGSASDFRGIGTGSADIARFEAAVEAQYDYVCQLESVLREAQETLAAAPEGTISARKAARRLADVQQELANAVQGLTEARTRLAGGGE